MKMIMWTFFCLLLMTAIGCTPHQPPGEGLEKIVGNPTPAPTPVDEGPCAVTKLVIDTKNGQHLETPFAGKWVEESHYATSEASYGEAKKPFPSNKGEGMFAHLEATCTYLKSRGLPCPKYPNSWQTQWTPANDGTINEWGQGARGNKKPTVAEEVWQGNMYWQSGKMPKHPAKWLVCSDTKCLVVAFGHESGPGSKAFVGGFTPEVFSSLGVKNNATLTLKGAMKNQKVDFGPINCKK